MNPMMKSIGVAKRGRPLQIVASQQKIWMPLGIAIIVLVAVKKLAGELRNPRREHVVHPQSERHER